MSHTYAELLEAVATPNWGPRVVAALKIYFASGQPLMEPIELLSADLEIDPTGRPVLVAVYKAGSSYPPLIGYRRPLDREPFMLVARESPEDSMAEAIAIYEISEPIAPADSGFTLDGAGISWWTWPPDQ